MIPKPPTGYWLNCSIGILVGCLAHSLLQDGSYLSAAVLLVAFFAYIWNRSESN